MESIERDGFAIVPEVLTNEQVDGLIAAIGALQPGTSESSLERSGEVYASRNILRDVPAVRAIAWSPALRQIVVPLLGATAFPVRGLLFDKTPGANWTVPWHQDTTIAVRARHEAEGYHAWTRKAGVVHVQPPIAVLEAMITVRLHLDECGPESGPLRVVAGSHRAGRLDAQQTRYWIEQNGVTTCLVPRGGAIVMRPLILHTSRPSDAPSHRRVVHLEYAARPLPGGVEWNEPATASAGDPP